MAVAFIFHPTQLTVIALPFQMPMENDLCSCRVYWLETQRKGIVQWRLDLSDSIQQPMKSTFSSLITTPKLLLNTWFAINRTHSNCVTWFLWDFLLPINTLSNYFLHRSQQLTISYKVGISLTPTVFYCLSITLRFVSIYGFLEENVFPLGYRYVFHGKSSAFCGR